jgi:hypothetical protein
LTEYRNSQAFEPCYYPIDLLQQYRIFRPQGRKHLGTKSGKHAHRQLATARVRALRIGVVVYGLRQ